MKNDKTITSSPYKFIVNNANTYLLTGSILALAFCAFITRNVHANAGALSATRIEVDQKAGVVRIMIDGTEAAKIARDGLHVADDISYGGMITDAGVHSMDEGAP